jgi:hypothetical protein
MKISNFELKEMLDQNVGIKLGGESDGDGLESQKLYLNPLNDPLLAEK